MGRKIIGFNERYTINENGDVYSTFKQKNLSPNKHYKTGYLSVNLKLKRISKRFSIHRLVAEYFIPNPNNLPEVNHINGLKTDNRVDNLEWVTSSGNRFHAVSLGNHYLKPVTVSKPGSEMRFRSIRECADFLKTDISFVAKKAKRNAFIKGVKIYYTK
jgi:hypothetical protein